MEKTTFFRVAVECVDTRAEEMTIPFLAPLLIKLRATFDEGTRLPRIAVEAGPVNTALLCLKLKIADIEDIDWLDLIGRKFELEYA